jgi:hypothetical protein
MTPYELRFAIFKQSYAMLQDDYNMKFEVAQRQTTDGLVSTDFAEKYPTLNQVLKQAEIINDFVSSK